MAHRSRRRVWLLVGLVLIVLACTTLVLVLPKLIARVYLEQTRKPIALQPGRVGTFPTECHLDDVPWIATQEWYCQSNSLAMIAAQHRIDEPTGYFNFLTGFTYGASRQPGQWDFMPYADPEAGFGAAAPYLGLVRRYYVTDDPALYLDALRYYLSQGHAVRLAVNGCLLPEMEPCASAHSEVLVGYDTEGFFYYETVAQLLHLPPGEEGIWVSERTLLDAVESWSGAFATPWRYALTIFEGGPAEPNLRPIWTRNGRLLAGGSRFGPRQGADAGEALATQVEESWSELDLASNDFGTLRCAVEAASYTRHSNAAYLRTVGGGESDVGRAADLFDRAADCYASALAALEDGVSGRSEAERIASALRDAAASEREIGGIFLSKGGE